MSKTIPLLESAVWVPDGPAPRCPDEVPPTLLTYSGEHKGHGEGRGVGQDAYVVGVKAEPDLLGDGIHLGSAGEGELLA